MTVRGTLGLATVFTLLAGYLFATRAPSTPAPDATTRLTPPLATATLVELTGGDRGQVRLARSADGTWATSIIPDVLDGVASLQVLAVLDAAPVDPESYGLGPDATRLRVLEGTTELVAIAIGAMNPAETGIYVRHLGQRPVLLVGALLRWELEKLRRVISTTPAP
jgi:hypothetical protein